MNRLFCTSKIFAKFPPVAWNWSCSKLVQPHFGQTYCRRSSLYGIFSFSYLNSRTICRRRIRIHSYADMLIAYWKTSRTATNILGLTRGRTIKDFFDRTTVESVGNPYAARRNPGHGPRICLAYLGRSEAMRLSGQLCPGSPPKRQASHIGVFLHTEMQCSRINQWNQP